MISTVTSMHMVKIRLMIYTVFLNFCFNRDVIIEYPDLCTV